MGIYVNPGNSDFAEINDQNYVDKTMLIEQINRKVGKKNKLTCVSRPRRFGKSYAAKMLAAYYDCSCDSHELFADKKIAGTSDYRNHLNKYSESIWTSPLLQLMLRCRIVHCRMFPA